jgi:hypothetical protein
MNESLNAIPVPNTFALLQKERECLKSLKRQYEDERKINPSDAADLLIEISACEAEIVRLTEFLTSTQTEEESHSPSSTVVALPTKTARQHIDDLYKILEK